MTFEELKAEAERQGYILVKVEIPKLDSLFVDCYGKPMNIEPDQASKDFQDLINTVTEKSLDWHLQHAAMGFLDPIAECYNALNALEAEDNDESDTN